MPKFMRFRVHGLLPSETADFTVKREALSRASATSVQFPDRDVKVVEFDIAPRAKKVFVRTIWPYLGPWEPLR